MKRLFNCVMIKRSQMISGKYPSSHLIKGSCIKLPSIRYKSEIYGFMNSLAGIRKNQNAVLQGQSSSSVRRCTKHSIPLGYITDYR